jgi:hypothetical protein
MLRNGSNVQVLNFAVSGATCSNSLYPRNITLADGTIVPLPAVDSQIETFQQYNRTLSEEVDYTALIFIGVGTTHLAGADSRSNTISLDKRSRHVFQRLPI